MDSSLDIFLYQVLLKIQIQHLQKEFYKNTSYLVPAKLVGEAYDTRQNL